MAAMCAALCRASRTFCDRVYPARAWSRMHGGAVPWYYRDMRSRKYRVVMTLERASNLLIRSLCARAVPKTARPSGRGSACSSVPAGSADSKRPARATIGGPAVVWMAVGGEP
jgi:hypothetical protein